MAPWRFPDPLTDNETVTIFWQHCLTYYNHLIGQADASFDSLVQIGEQIEDGLKTIKDYQILFE